VQAGAACGRGARGGRRGLGTLAPRARRRARQAVGVAAIQTDLSLSVGAPAARTCRRGPGRGPGGRGYGQVIGNKAGGGYSKPWQGGGEFLWAALQVGAAGPWVRAGRAGARRRGWRRGARARSERARAGRASQRRRWPARRFQESRRDAPLGPDARPGGAGGAAGPDERGSPLPCPPGALGAGSSAEVGGALRGGAVRPARRALTRAAWRGGRPAALSATALLNSQIVLGGPCWF
jgi:hypothetical protein